METTGTNNTGLDNTELGKPGRRVVSVWFPRLATNRIARQRSADARSVPLANPLAEPLATVEQIQSGFRLAAVNRTAEQMGLAAGHPLADARALVPNLETVPADPADDAKALKKLALWAGRYSPWTTPWETGDSTQNDRNGLWLDISGCAHLFGGEAVLLEDLINRLGRAGLEVQAGLAGTPGAAWALARYGLSGNRQFRRIAPGTEREALAELPVAALRLPPDTVETLVRLGLRQIGNLYPLNRAALAQRVGLTPVLRLDQALGERDEPLSPLMPAPVLQTRLRFPDPIGLKEDIQAALDRLLPALCERLERVGQGARRLDLVLYRIDGSTSRATIGTSRPERDPEHLNRLFREKLDGLDPGFGVETAILAACAVAPLTSQQQETGEIAGASDGENPPRPASWLIDRLANRLGPDRVAALHPRESHLPEQAQELRPLAREARETEPPDKAPHAPTAPRPLHLLPVPEPIDALLPQPLAAPVLFRWRGRGHRIVRAEGPERIAPEWWRDLTPNEDRDPPEVRDYYRVEDENGGRFWLYRQNRPLPGRSPQWYLHGLFP